MQRIGLDAIQEEEQALTAHALRGMARIGGVKIYGTKSPESESFNRKGGVIVFDLGRKMPGRVARELAERGGIGVRSGCHCAHLLVKRLVGVPSFLEWLQGLFLTVVPSLSLPGVVRISLGIENTVEDIDTLLHELSDIAGQQVAESDGNADSTASEATKISSSTLSSLRLALH